jgi:hypothetical protein
MKLENARIGRRALRWRAPYEVAIYIDYTRSPRWAHDADATQSSPFGNEEIKKPFGFQEVPVKGVQNARVGPVASGTWMDHLAE